MKWGVYITGTTSKIDSICFMYDTSMGSTLKTSPSTSNVAGKSLITEDAALRHASAKINLNETSEIINVCFIIDALHHKVTNAGYRLIKLMIITDNQSL